MPYTIQPVFPSAYTYYCTSFNLIEHFFHCRALQLELADSVVVQWVRNLDSLSNNFS
jgi:hypothetical protein